MEDLFRSLAAQQLMKRRQGAKGPAQPSPPFQPPAPTRPAAPAPTAGPSLTASPTMPSPAVPSPYLARRQQGSIGSSFPELSRR